MDLDERSLGLAKHLCPTCEFVNFDPFCSPGPYTGYFNIIFCSEVFEHMIAPDQSLTALIPLLAPGGTLILTVPNGRNDQSSAGERRDDTRDDTSYSGHINFWSPESWTFFLRKNVQGSIETGFMSSGDIFAVIHESEANNRYR